MTFGWVQCIIFSRFVCLVTTQTDVTFDMMDMAFEICIVMRNDFSLNRRSINDFDEQNFPDFELKKYVYKTSIDESLHKMHI